MPLYQTRLGQAYLGDSLEVLRDLSSESVNLIVTSPPFPLTFQKKKPYGSVRIDEYVSWFLPLADQCKRLLTKDGSFVIDIGGVYGDLVLDPFAGSNITGEAAERLGRRWIAVELVEEYLEGSKFRFPPLFVTSGVRSRSVSSSSGSR